MCGNVVLSMEEEEEEEEEEELSGRAHLARTTSANFEEALRDSNV